MALEIVRLYTKSLSEFFTASDIAVADRARKEGEDLAIPPFVPEGSTVLTAAFFAERISEDVADCVTEMNAVDISGEATQALKGLLDNLRWRLNEAIASTWARGALGARPPAYAAKVLQIHVPCISSKIGAGLPCPRANSGT